MKKTVFISIPFILFSILFIFIGFNEVFRNKNKCGHVSGIVTAIYEDGTKDAVFKIAGQKSKFYINRGLEGTFSLSGLLAKLKGKEVTILFADNFTPLGSIAECRHISELSTNEELVYTEFE
ncbi:hypothetical protein [Aurantibacillus circumpalustris]|uniref:hypothetical protein n=1 Tax=Aurantibacillus circumpalustris TaxID=3036359 RepID=UPI00295A70F8|nr:hypothetical protein [Aurantibacillus circumpalustris]